MPTRLTRALTQALHGLGGASFCPACQRSGEHPGPGCNIVEKGEEQRMCAACDFPVDYQGIAIGTVINGVYEAPGLIVIDPGYRARILGPLAGVDRADESFG